MRRDFTYIDDIAEGVIRVLDTPARPDVMWDSEHPAPNSSSAPYRVYNIGNHQPVELLRVIQLLEDRLGKKAKRVMMPLQSGDVPATYADVDSLVEDIGFKPTTSIEEGIGRFVGWYREFYRI